ncbi:hypothetical protein B0H63DRAFT_485920 [Podospora didyma]|uniref:Uncharacterized protein n=1 Tax=Podospora didyma TaxID=330526 RepID=A0AAE0K5W5_9PEZI|nr:hypothetical protein B0H63DRAFT_485920 [Podospora didyma]
MGRRALTRKLCEFRRRVKFSCLAAGLDSIIAHCRPIVRMIFFVSPGANLTNKTHTIIVTICYPGLTVCLVGSSAFRQVRYTLASGGVLFIQY